MNKVILLAGHDEFKKGATFDDINEFDEMIQWVEIVNLMKQFKIAPPMSLKEKVRYVNRERPLAAVSLHLNSDPSRRGHGSETLYHPNSKYGKMLAECIQAELGKQSKPDRGIKEGWYRQDHPGQEDYVGDVEGDESVLYLLRKTICPAVIVELAFIHDWKYMNNKSDICESIATGIDKYVRRVMS